MVKPKKNGGWLSSFIISYFPLAFIPLVFGIVLPWGYSNLPQLGQDFGNILIGSVAAYLFLFHSDARQRRLMIIMQVFAFAFETANVSSGFYHYVYPATPYYAAVPLWITLGWAVMGWWAVRAFEDFRKIPQWFSYSLVAAALLAIGFAFNYWTPSMLFALVGVFLAQKAVKEIPLGVIAFAAIFGIINEVAGPLNNIWSFTDSFGFAHLPEFGQLSIGYAYVLIFCMWLAGYDELKK